MPLLLKNSILFEENWPANSQHFSAMNFEDLDLMEIPDEEKANEVLHENQHESILVHNKGNVKKSDVIGDY